VTALFNRIGNLGLLLIACALLLGGLAGAAVAHHYEQAGQAISSQEAGAGKDRGDQKQKPGHGNPKHPNQGHQGPADNEPPDND
jgi:hypothetical protein